jgi:hypothetical protein
LTDQPELTASDGERATLRPSGAWTVANVEVIEGLCESALPAQVGAIDLSRVTALDTVGAWLFEKLVRRFSTPSAKTSLVGVSESYAGLMQEILGVNRGQPAARRRDGFLLDFLERIGRALAAESAAFLQMLGAVGERERAGCGLPARDGQPLCQRRRDRATDVAPGHRRLSGTDHRDGVADLYPIRTVRSDHA